MERKSRPIRTVGRQVGADAARPTTEKKYCAIYRIPVVTGLPRRVTRVRRMGHGEAASEHRVGHSPVSVGSVGSACN
jgi:hypothetical protein